MINDPETDAILAILNQRATDIEHARIMERVFGQAPVVYSCSDMEIVMGVVYVF